MKFIDIHTHTCYNRPDSTLVLNVFPGEPEKLSLHVFCSVGLHPWHVQEDRLETDLHQVSSMATHQNVVAIGETGLDKAVDIPFAVQRRAFENQLSLSESLGKVVIIHCVRSYSEMLEYRKKSDLTIPWIFHWFNSVEQTAAQLISKNCYLSFGHMLFNENSRAYRTFKTVPANHIFFETDDAGYTIQQIYERASLMRKTTPEELKMQILDNFSRCFKLS